MRTEERIKEEHEIFKNALKTIAEVDIPYAPMTDHSVKKFYEKTAREALEANHD